MFKDLRERGCGDIGRINLALDQDQMRARRVISEKSKNLFAWTIIIQTAKYSLKLANFVDVTYFVLGYFKLTMN
jgi:hypothetical protein